MPVQPIAVANEMLDRFGQQGWIDPLKLQKLLYFSNGWWLGLTGEPLLTERPEVWRYGPVFRSVYNAFARYGNGRIEAPAPGLPLRPQAAPIRLDVAEQDAIVPFLNWVWTEYGSRSGVSLSNDTHATGTPWQRIAAANHFAVPLGTEIPTPEDYAYFARLARERGWPAAALNPNFAA